MADMKLEVIRGFSTATPLALIPTEERRSQVLRRGQLVKEALHVDLDIALRLVDEIEQEEAWKIAGETKERFFRFVCGIALDDLPRIRTGYQIIRGRGVGGPITIDDVPVLAARQRGIEGGKAGPGRGKKTADDISRFNHGTSAAYLIAKLKRDHPAIAERLAIGEFPSVRAAARAAGLTVDTPPLVLLRRAWKHASEAKLCRDCRWAGL
jgi:hypothetical protein